MPTEQQVAAAALALVNAALPSSGANIVRAYDPSTIPATKPAEFVILTVVRRSGGNARAGQYLTTGWEFYVLAASATSVANARNSLRLAGSALEGKRITAGGETSTPVKFDNGRPVAEDDDYFSGVNAYTCAI